MKFLKVNGDLALVIYQFQDEYETYDGKLVQYKKLILELVKGFKKFDFQHLPMEKNQIVDALAILSTMIKVTR